MSVIIIGGRSIEMAGPTTLFWAASTARFLMKHHGLGDEWKFDWDRAKSRFGFCNNTRKRISMSSHLTPHMTREHAMQTMLHEIAHALLPLGIGHGPEWQRLVVRIGGTAERCGGPLPESAPKPPCILRCVACGAIVARRHRRTDMTRKRHTPCGSAGRLAWN